MTDKEFTESEAEAAARLLGTDEALLCSELNKLVVEIANSEPVGADWVLIDQMKKLASESRGQSVKLEDVYKRGRRIISLGKMYGIPVRHRVHFKGIEGELELIEAAVRLRK
jgi:hypothetical protein